MPAKPNEKTQIGGVIYFRDIIFYIHKITNLYGEFMSDKGKLLDIVDNLKKVLREMQ